MKRFIIATVLLTIGMIAWGQGISLMMALLEEVPSHTSRPEPPSWPSRALMEMSLFRKEKA